MVLLFLDDSSPLALISTDERVKILENLVAAGISDAMLSESFGRSICMFVMAYLKNKTKHAQVVILAGATPTLAAALCSARHLVLRGLNVSLCMTKEAHTQSTTHGAAMDQLKVLHGTSVKILQVADLEASEPSVVVDALMGYEFTKMGEDVEAMIKWANKHDHTLSLELPAGVDPSNGHAPGASVTCRQLLTSLIPVHDVTAALGSIPAVFLCDSGIPTEVFKAAGVTWPAFGRRWLLHLRVTGAPIAKTKDTAAKKIQQVVRRFKATLPKGAKPFKVRTIEVYGLMAFELEDRKERRFRKHGKPVEVIDVIKFSGKPLKGPLHKGLDQVTSKEAVLLFIEVLRATGSKSSPDPMRNVKNVVRAGFHNPRLRNELFCQLVKQTIGCPHAVTAFNAWKVLLVCIGVFSPSSWLVPHLLNYMRKPYKTYLAKGTAPDNGLIQISQWCVHQFMKTLQHGNRVSFPTNVELKSSLRHTPIKLTVQYLDGAEVELGVHSQTSVHDAMLNIERERHTMEGILLKKNKRGMIKKYVQRYFKLDKDNLNYWDTKQTQSMGADPSVSLELEYLYSVTPDPEKPCFFEIAFKGDEVGYSLQALTDVDATAWIEALRTYLHVGLKQNLKTVLTRCAACKQVVKVPRRFKADEVPCPNCEHPINKSSVDFSDHEGGPGSEASFAHWQGESSFGLYQVAHLDGEFKHVDLLGDSARLLDVVSGWMDENDKLNKNNWVNKKSAWSSDDSVRHELEFKLVVQARFFLWYFLTEKMLTKRGLHLYYIQAVHDVVHGNYPTTAAQMWTFALLQLCVKSKGGSETDITANLGRTLRDYFPAYHVDQLVGPPEPVEEARKKGKKMKKKERRALVAAYHEERNDKENKVAAKMITEMKAQYGGKDILVVKRMYLNLAERIPHYGSTPFHVEQWFDVELDDWDFTAKKMTAMRDFDDRNPDVRTNKVRSPTQFHLCIGERGLLYADVKSRKPRKHHKLQVIPQCGHYPGHFYYITGDPLSEVEKQRVYVFRTHEGEVMTRLVNKYKAASRYHLEWDGEAVQEAVQTKVD